MKYLRHYYVTLCGDYRGKYVEIMATDKDRAFDGVVKVYGVLNVFKVYTDKAWERKYTDIFAYLGYIVSEDETKARKERQYKRYGVLVL